MKKLWIYLLIYRSDKYAMTLQLCESQYFMNKCWNIDLKAVILRNLWFYKKKIKYKVAILCILQLFYIKSPVWEIWYFMGTIHFL